MKFRRFVALCVVTTIPLLASCGGSDPAADPSSAPSPDGTAAVDVPATPAGAANSASGVDVCALLTSQDAAAVAQERGLSGGSGKPTYTLTSTVQDYPNLAVPTSGCKFTIAGGGASGTVVIEVVSAENFALYSDGEAVPGLGDEAVSQGGTTVVRVGDLMLQTSENSFTEAFVVALYRKMIPNLS